MGALTAKPALPKPPAPLSFRTPHAILVWLRKSGNGGLSVYRMLLAKFDALTVYISWQEATGQLA